MKPILLTLSLLVLTLCSRAQHHTLLLNNNWTFHLGNAASMASDFGHGTEYFTFLSKAVGQNQGPANPEFNDSAWTRVTLPHDWVVDLPFSREASHSHGYKQVGWKYPANSVGWYRRHFTIGKADEGRHISVRFDGIYRDAQVFCNGFYLGHEPSGYAVQEYDLTPYLNYGGDNVLTVRCNASLEEGWYYEGAGICRDVWLVMRDARHYISDVNYLWQEGQLQVMVTATDSCVNTLLDAEGNVVAQGSGVLHVIAPHLWSPDAPYLYTLRTETRGGEDAVTTKVGLRTLTYDATQGIRLNGQPIKLKGANVHLDHAGVGVAVPRALWVYRIQQLKKLGMNAIRCSHNPAPASLLEVCDSLGMMVIDENRLMGVNAEHLDLLRRMMVAHRTHPSVVLWSIGNEEWWIEGNEKGEKIARTMIDYARTIDASRPFTYGNSGGYGIVKQVDVHGYNYIVQNDVDNRHREHPDWLVIGTEETSGCGTRNVYATDSLRGWMASINRMGEERSQGEKNVIERGWKFYRDNCWAGGVFYWTGFDYRGEPNPMKWPATGSQFGVLDYCGFPKDEAWYLQAAWTNQPVLHLFPHWNLKGQEGQPVEVWAYANVDEVELWQDGKSLGRKKMPCDGHLTWTTTYRPGRLMAQGYRNGKRVITQQMETTGEATGIMIQPSTRTLRADGQDVAIIDLALTDSKGREVADGCNDIEVTVEGSAEILGWGNGDPGYKEAERPQGTDHRHASFRAFMGRAQVIIRSVPDAAPTPINVQVGLKGQRPQKLALQAVTSR
jgi:beta-galactosidase